MNLLMALPRNMPIVELYKVFLASFQFVISGVLASYGVLLVSLVDETGVTLREAIWTPITYSISCCLAGNINFSKNVRQLK